MKVVVIGGTGHIGSYLVPRLVSAGHEVVAISRGHRSPYFEHPAWRHVTQVQADREAEDEAGVFGKRLADAQPDAVIDLLCFTLASARQLLDALAPTRCYLLHCGTVWVHGTATTVPVTEEAARQPFGDYGTQKATIEQLLLSEARRGALPCTVLHPGHIVGPGWAPVNPAGNFNVNVFSRLAQGEELSLPHFGLETVHHVHADDVAQAFEKALAHPSRASGEAFHVVSEKAITLRGFAERVAGWDATDAQATWEHVSRSPSMSIEKAAATLGYRPRYSSLEAVFEAVSWLVADGQVNSGGRKMAF
jgi:nucleoside-diphosphate-sugar epimerase